MPTVTVPSVTVPVPPVTTVTTPPVTTPKPPPLPPPPAPVPSPPPVTASATASYYVDSFSITELAPAPLQHDFEDGTLQGWIPRGGSVVLSNTTEARVRTGTRSLKTTGRTAGFNGPSLNLLGQLTKGATYQVTVSVRLVTGEAPTTVRVTMQRTPAGGANQFDTIASNAERHRCGVGHAHAACIRSRPT